VKARTFLGARNLVKGVSLCALHFNYMIACETWWLGCNFLLFFV